MSRSSLERQYKRRLYNARNEQYKQATVSGPYEHDAYSSYQQNMTTGYPMCQQQASMTATYAQSTFVPIRLTGDDAEDNVQLSSDKHEGFYSTVTDRDYHYNFNRLPVSINSTCNINNMLYNNIMESEYFRALHELKTYHEVVTEINASVKHVEPWGTGTSRVPSSAFCLLMKFMVMKLTKRQMDGLLHTKGNPLVRAIGLLYLRYTLPPKYLWDYFVDFIEDSEIIYYSSDTSVSMSIGEYCMQLLCDMSYFGTTLPRIPVPIERKIKVMLLILEHKQKRREINIQWMEEYPGAFDPGTHVLALYSDATTEPCWYEAMVEPNETRKSASGYHDMCLWVKFRETGDSFWVDLGDIMLVDSRRGPSRLEQSYAPHRSISSEELNKRVYDSSRDACLSKGKQYSTTITSYKRALALKQDSYTARKRSREESPDRTETIVMLHRPVDDLGGLRGGCNDGNSSDDRLRDRKMPGDRNAHRNGISSDHLQKLTAIYGDASGSK